MCSSSNCYCSIFACSPFVYANGHKTSVCVSNASMLVFCSNDEHRHFRCIPVHGDGQCLFRCGATYCNQILQSCMRSQHGLPISGELAQFETGVATALRKEVLDLISQNINELNYIQSSLSVFLDREIGKKYCSLTERIESMKSTTEFAGNLEIVALAHNLRRQICVYQRAAGCTEKFTLRAKFPTTDGWPCMNIAYRMDTAVIAGHFDLLTENLADISENNIELDTDTLTKSVNLFKPDISFMDTILAMCGVDWLPAASAEPAQSTPDPHESVVEHQT